LGSNAGKCIIILRKVDKLSIVLGRQISEALPKIGTIIEKLLPKNGAIIEKILPKNGTIIEKIHTIEVKSNNVTLPAITIHSTDGEIVEKLVIRPQSVYESIADQEIQFIETCRIESNEGTWESDSEYNSVEDKDVSQVNQAHQMINVELIMASPQLKCSEFEFHTNNNPYLDETRKQNTPLDNLIIPIKPDFCLDAKSVCLEPHPVDAQYENSISFYGFKGGEKHELSRTFKRTGYSFVKSKTEHKLSRYIGPLWDAIKVEKDANKPLILDITRRELYRTPTLSTFEFLV
jgi:hypothetical protein